MPKYVAVALAERGHLAPIAHIEAMNPRHAWYLVSTSLIMRRLPDVREFWRKGGYLIQDEDGVIHRPIRPGV